MKITSFIIAVAILCIGVSAFAQHSNQFDDGSGHYSTLKGSTSGGTYTFPNGSGTLLTAGSGTQPKFALTTVNANYTVLTTDQLVQVNTGGGNITVTLPNANTFSAGQTVVIKNFDPTSALNKVIIKTTNAVLGDNGQTIDDWGAAAFPGSPIAWEGVLRLYSDGVSTWHTW
jgi:hypothetical protein